MASFSAEIRVAGQVFPVLRCSYQTSQATDSRGRVVAKVQRGPVELLLDVPAGNLFLDWASNPRKRYPVSIVWRAAAGGQALETLTMAGAYCVGYQELFASGDLATGSYQCQLTLSDPDGWTWQPAGPAAPLQAYQQNPFGLTLKPPVELPPPGELPVEVPPPPSPPTLGVLARLLALLPELTAAAALAVLVPTNSRDDSGYQSEWDYIRRNTPPTDKDRAELADLEQRHQNGTLTAQEEAHLLALLARVRGLRLQKLAELRQIKPDYEEVEIVTTGNAVVGEFDGINLKEKMFIENKTAKGMYAVNPKTGLRAQTSEEWAIKHIFDKTQKRIDGLKIAAATRPTKKGTPAVPSIDQIRDFRRLHFRIEEDTPNVRGAIEKQVQKLEITNPDWEFTTEYGK